MNSENQELETKQEQKSEDEIAATLITTVFPAVVLPFFVLSIIFSAIVLNSFADCF